MAMKRVVNRTQGTLVLTFGDGAKYNITLPRLSASNPLPEAHPLFMETSLANLQAKGIVSVLKEADYSVIKQQLKAQLAAKRGKAQRTPTRLSDHARKVKEVEAHNKLVEQKKEVKRLMDQTMRTDTAERLVDEEKLVTKEIPKVPPVAPPVEPNYATMAVAPSAPVEADPEHEELVLEIQKEAARSAPKKKRTRKSKKAKSEAPVVEEDPTEDPTEEEELPGEE